MQTHSSMKLNLFILITFLALTLMILSPATASQPQDPLPSWNDGPNKQAIIEFVTKTTDQNQATYIPPARRIATFDNDGTLWSEDSMKGHNADGKLSV